MMAPDKLWFGESFANSFSSALRENTLLPLFLSFFSSAQNEAHSSTHTKQAIFPHLHYSSIFTITKLFHFKAIGTHESVRLGHNPSHLLVRPDIQRTRCLDQLRSHRPPSGLIGPPCWQLRLPERIPMGATMAQKVENLPRLRQSGETSPVRIVQAKQLLTSSECQSCSQLLPPQG